VESPATLAEPHGPRRMSVSPPICHLHRGDNAHGDVGVGYRIESFTSIQMLNCWMFVINARLPPKTTLSRPAFSCNICISCMHQTPKTFNGTIQLLILISNQ
jgi:hypothetical protein